MGFMALAVDLFKVFAFLLMVTTKPDKSLA